MNRVNYRWNMAVNVLDVALFHFGISLIALAVVYPALLERLGAPANLIALLPAIQILAGRLPQVATSYLAEMRPRQKAWCATCGVFQRVPWLILAGCIAAWGVTRPGWVIAAALVCLLVANAGFGFTAPAWGELIAKAIPSDRRGWFMGLIHTLGNGLGVVGGLIVTAVMQSPRLDFPHNYALLFALCFGVLGVSFVIFLFNREEPGANHAQHESFAAYRQSLGNVLRSDPAFRWFLVYQSLAYAYVVGQGLFMVYALRTFGLTDTHAGHFVLASTVAVLAASPLLGWAGDRLGHKLVLLIATGAAAGAAGIAATATDWRWMYVVFGLLAMNLSGQVIGTQNIVLQFATPTRRPTYLALAGTIPAPFVLGFSLLGGWLARSGAGFRAAFAMSAAASLAAWLVLALKVPGQRAAAPAPVLEEIGT